MTDFSQSFTVSSVFKHRYEDDGADRSQAEGYPTYLRVFIPNYLSYTTSDSFATNFTYENETDPVEILSDEAIFGDGTGNIHGSFEIKFAGVTFADIIRY